ncbi:hypothetical protein DI53_0037 [Sphingobacterium deserti]|uniref:Uncharacterized protein n=1 Tax=Sphingobacterium deserti TaxID=1229276 RepID=A0A0B8TBD8_9SPHI|nr:hypothetical protein DI53_0037 [Sphingobacterium deserti]
MLFYHTPVRQSIYLFAVFFRSIDFGFKSSAISIGLLEAIRDLLSKV